MQIDLIIIIIIFSLWFIFSIPGMIQMWIECHEIEASVAGWTESPKPSPAIEGKAKKNLEPADWLR